MYAQNNSESFVDSDGLQLATNRITISKRKLANHQNIAIGYIVSFVVIGLVIVGTIGNIMCMAVFRMYQRSSKSSATFLMQVLCVVDTFCLLCSAPENCNVIFYSRIKR